MWLYGDCVWNKFMIIQHCSWMQQVFMYLVELAKTALLEQLLVLTLSIIMVSSTSHCHCRVSLNFVSKLFQKFKSSVSTGPHYRDTIYMYIYRRVVKTLSRVRVLNVEKQFF
jgi:hypothetical protein